MAGKNNQKVQKEIMSEDVDRAYLKLKEEAEKRGYYLNPDVEFTKALISSLLINEQRYGYWACPCRLASGVRQEDLDIICPCDYRDIDINQFGTCFCGLYVSYDAAHGKKTISSIPERRPNAEERKKMKANKENAVKSGQTTLPKLPIWRCTVCGYLCAREEAPDICPICLVPKDRFERFM
ncbi:MAG TPA: ferredoxin-thioredoxin reductase catalytic domain-containing protein [Candidatus Nanoarchaeia archaeon]|nr:ferredoxin-thioredoxin reductase catalytic domain-containing protein [Candidatus Nanoarchaeia archaeon]